MLFSKSKKNSLLIILADWFLFADESHSYSISCSLQCWLKSLLLWKNKTQSEYFVVLNAIYCSNHKCPVWLVNSELIEVNWKDILWVNLTVFVLLYGSCLANMLYFCFLSSILFQLFHCQNVYNLICYFFI